jgi:hypothetical protein
LKDQGSSGCKLVQRKVEGHHILTLENDLIRISIDVDQGAHIFEMTNKWTNIDILYKDPKSLVDYDVGGWYELFPNAGKACNLKGTDIPGHGDVRYLPWKFEVQQEKEAEIRLYLWTESVVLPFKLEKTITLLREQAVLYVSEKITNHGTSAEPYLWGHHMTFGAPFISSKSRIDLPACRIYNQSQYHSEASRLTKDASGTLDRMPGINGDMINIKYFPSEPSSEMLFIDGLQSHWYNVFNEQANLGFAVAWDKKTFPYLWLWQEHHSAQQQPFNGQVYGMALEPQASNVPILANAVAQGEAPVLPAGQSEETWLTVVMHHFEDHVKLVTQHGEVII